MRASSNAQHTLQTSDTLAELWTLRLLLNQSRNVSKEGGATRRSAQLLLKTLGA